MQTTHKTQQHVTQQHVACITLINYMERTMFCYNTTTALNSLQNAQLKTDYLACVNNYLTYNTASTVNAQELQAAQVSIDEAIYLINLLNTYNTSANTLVELEQLVNAISALDSYVRDFFAQFFKTLTAYEEENYAGEWD
jgi:hypothetical protein